MNKWRMSAGLTAVQMTYVVMLSIAVPALVYLYKTYSYSGEQIQAQAYTYPQSYVPDAQCSDGAARVADHEALKSEKNVGFNVTTPSNYRSDFPHRLLMVWAPSGFNDKLSERFTGLTGLATQQGYIVVHIASVPLGFKALDELATIPKQVIARWCVNDKQVYYTGHSDGGTVANALAVIDAREVSPRVIAPSAMGMQGDDMSAYQCPDPTNVLLMHNQGDDHFSGYGDGVAAWWAQCNQCGAAKPSSVHPDCMEFADCTDGVRTLFCQADGNHAYWPAFYHNMLDFFDERAGLN